jgi:hypothetical protein
MSQDIANVPGTFFNVALHGYTCRPLNIMHLSIRCLSC